MDNQPAAPSAWKRFGIPALILAVGLLWGLSGHHGGGSNDWAGAIMAMFVWPALLVITALGAAFGAGKAFGTFCLRALLFLVAVGVGEVFSFLWH